MDQTKQTLTLTRLRLKIQEEQWEGTVAYLQTQIGIDESRLYTGGELPIHFTLGMNSAVPLSVIVALISAFPHSVSLYGKNGMMPLHIAVHSNVSIEIVRYLIQMYSDALAVKDEDGKIPKEYGYDDQDKVLERPSVCYKTQDKLHASLRKREEKFCHVLPKFQLLRDRQKKHDKQAARFEDGYNRLLQAAQMELKRSEDVVNIFMDDLESIQDEVDGFVDKSTKRMKTLELDLKKRSSDQSQWDKEESRRRIEWYKQLKIINEEMERLTNETKECEQQLHQKLEQGAF